MHYCSIFQQLFKFIPRYRFDKMVEKVSSDRYCKNFSAWQQFLTCLYAQITGKDSLREIASGLATNQSRLYHLGMAAVAKSTLADAMNRWSPDIFEALFKEILERSRYCLTSLIYEILHLSPRATLFFDGLRQKSGADRF